MSDYSPDFSDIDDDNVLSDDELTIDMSGVQGKTGFDAVPAAWYLAKIIKFENIKVGPTAAKLAPGTPGTSWELVVQEDVFDNKYEGRHLWTRHYHAGDSIAYLKGFLEATDAFEDGELDASFNLNQRERAVDTLVCVKVSRREYPPNTKEYTNDIRNVRSAADWAELRTTGGSESSSSTSLLPD